MDHLDSSINDSYARQIRWQPCFNTTNEMVPPFACMLRRRPKQFSETKAAKNTDPPQRYACQHLRGAEVLWDITKCNAESESLQDPSMFVFNGPVPIPPLTPGRCTEDLPCQVLHNGNRDQLLNFSACGPVADQWYVRSGRSAFTCVSHDVARGVGTGMVHTIWIARGTGQTVNAHARIKINETLSDGQYATLSIMPVNEDEPGLLTLDLAQNIKIIQDNEGNSFAMVQRAGIYFVGFHAKLSSATAPRAAALAVSLYRLPAKVDGETQTPVQGIYAAERDQDIEVDGYGAEIQHTAENVAFPGFENLKNGDAIGLRNTSAHAITLARGVFTICSVGAYFNPSKDRSGGLNFDSI